MPLLKSTGSSWACPLTRWHHQTQVSHTSLCHAACIRHVCKGSKVMQRVYIFVQGLRRSCMYGRRACNILHILPCMLTVLVM